MSNVRVLGLMWGATLGVFLGGSPAAAGDLTILAPRPHEVIQRVGFQPGQAPGGNFAPGQADVAIEVEVPSPIDRATAVARVVPIEGPPAVASPVWARVELAPGAKAGLHVGRLPVPARGWFRLEVRIDRADGSPPLTATVEPVGVGEVFLIAGQSYATNTNDERLTVADPQQRVVALDSATGGWRVANDPQPAPDGSDGGSIWPAVGDELAQRLGVPIGFANVAWGGTSSSQWQPGSELHERLVATGKNLGRFRAVLWQQGESDVINHTSTDDYVAAMERIRGAAVRAWGFEPAWLCAKSTHHPTVYDDPEGEGRIRAAVDRLVTMPGFGLGPDTDALQGDSRGDMNSRRHFSAIGQKRAAAVWAGVLLERLGKIPKGVEAASFLLADLHLLEPGWKSDIVWRESSVLRAASTSEPAKARLAFPAESILAVTTADGSRSLEPGVEWQHAPGSREVVFSLPTAVAPILDADRYLPENAEHSYRHRVGNPQEWLLYRPGRWFHDRDVEITSKRARGAGEGPAIDVVHGSLPKTRARIAAGKSLHLGISGDSISTGLDASETTGTPPYQPGWPDLVVAQLRVSTPSSVTHVNRAVAGWSVANGVADLDALLESQPDLVLVAYGMNDVGRRDPAWYREQTASIVARIREKLPESEVILVATMLGNDEWIHTPREMFNRYRDELKSLVSPGVALVDMTAVWEEQLQAKEMFDLTGNGLNHPNDFGHRLYAQGVLELILD
jgi:lysophospholipase L1-like esterase